MSTETKKPEKPIIQSKDYRTVFINAFRMRATENDASLSLAVEIDDPKGNVFLQDEVRVMMTPRSVKVLTLMLNRVLANMEKKMGPIELPPGKEDEINNAVLERHSEKISEG